MQKSEKYSTVQYSMNRNIQQPINIFNYAGEKVFRYKNNVAWLKVMMLLKGSYGFPKFLHIYPKIMY